MLDIIEKLKNCTIHHGQLNRRIFLLKLDAKECPGILPELDALAQEKGYSKIIAKVPSTMAKDFIRWGYGSEADIPGYYSGTDPDSNLFFMVKYMDDQRAVDTQANSTKLVLDKAAQKKGEGFPLNPPPSYVCRPADKSHTPKMADLYKKVFKTYPFPIEDPDFLAQTMDQNCRYMGIWKQDQLVSLASADINTSEKNAEMTDFATHPEHRGQQLSGILLQSLEALIAAQGIKTAYTIARAKSFGMNITFSRAGYCFTGTLINNTNISGEIENMNVWYKGLERLLRNK